MTKVKRKRILSRLKSKSKGKKKKGLNKHFRPNCKTIRYRNKYGLLSYFYYCKPVDYNDFKRYGKSLEIESNGFRIKLNGKQINSLKRVLRSVGEIGGRVDKEKCEIW